MSADPEYAQCLLFITHEPSRTDSSSRKLRNTSRGPVAPKGYALFPEVFKQKRPEVLEMFERHNLPVFNNQNISSFLLGENGKLGVIELLLLERPSASVDPLSLLTNKINIESVRLLFHNITAKVGFDHLATTVRPAVDEKNFKIVKRLITHKAGIRYLHEDGESFLHLAAKRGPESLVSELLDHRADIEVRSSNKETPLHVAVNNKNGPVVQKLLDRGANIEAKAIYEETPLHHASKNGLVMMVKLLLKNGAIIDSRDVKGQTSLHLAAFRGHVDVVETLLLNGADLNSKANDGRTPMFDVSWSRSIETTEVFLNFGAEIQVRINNQKVSILQESYSSYQFKLSRHLLESYFLDPALVKEAQVLEFMSDKQRNDPYSHYQHIIESVIILASHIVKIVALNLYNFVGELDVSCLWNYTFPTTLSNFKIQCNEEVARLKDQTIGDTDVSFYDFLAKDVPKVVRLLRNNSVAQITGSELRESFPIYGDILAHHFRKGKERKLLLEDCSKIFNFLFVDFKNLPDEIKEKILGYLNYKDLLSLKRACENCIKSKTEVSL